MSEFVPTIAILPGHPAYPNNLKLPEIAAALHDRAGISVSVPFIPTKLTRGPLTTAIWAEPMGFPSSDEQREGMDMLRKNMQGAHGLLIVNHASQNAFTGSGMATLHHSVSDRISTIAAFESQEDGIPVALMYEPVHEGGDTRLRELATRLEAINGLGATVVGEDLAGMPDFLANRVRPDFVVGPVV